MDRRAFIGSLAGGLLAAPLAAEAQPAGKVWRIGFLGPGSAEGYTDLLQGLRTRLHELGYVEGTIVLNTDSPRISTIDSRASRPNWFAARWTSSWRTHHRRS